MLKQEEGFKVFSVCFNWLLSGLYSVKTSLSVRRTVRLKGDGLLYPSALEEKMLVGLLYSFPPMLGGSSGNWGLYWF